MAPQQQSTRSAKHRGFLARCRWKERRRRHIAPVQHGDSGVAIPDDVLGRIFADFLDGASVVRCVATCRHWAGVVVRDAAVISRALQHLDRCLPDLAVGFFFQASDGPRARTGRRAIHTVVEPSFVPTASARRRFGFEPCLLSSLMNRLPFAEILDHSRPVASRHGRLVLELRRDSYTDGVKLCVCNPMAGDMVVLPELCGGDMPGYYACALLTGDDLQHPPTFFRVLLVYNRRGFTALRCYSSDEGRWSPQVRKVGRKITGDALRHLGPAVVLRGVAYWPLNHGAFGVRLSTREVENVKLLSYPCDPYSDNRLLGVSSDGRLSYISMMSYQGIPSVTVHLFPRDDEGDPTAGTLEWCGPPVMRIPQLNVTCYGDIKMRWFCEKSGIVLFTLGGGSRMSGTYALNLETREVETLVDGEGFSCKSFCGYEIDLAHYLTLLV